jgi:glycosyltransferase involved in cell wall biosynthesis/SAM-dependent methyltransferase
VDACTIIARNYFAQARVLARSFFKHHPGGSFSVLIIDAETPPLLEAEERFRVLVPLQIGFDEGEFHRLATIYDVMELATAVKPQLLKFLLAEGVPAVTYFDPDIEIFRPLDDIDALAREHSIVLTPHTLDPLPHDQREPGEVTLLLAGMFNLGFIAVGAGAGGFLDWWAQRVARDCRVAPEQGEFVDQRWIDFVPSLFDHYVLRDPGSNVAHWNLETRTFEWTGKEYRVNGKPLRFFHYSGFDPERPHVLSKFLGPSPTILLSEEPALARIVGEYTQKLFEAGYRESSKQPYALDALPSGLPLDRRIRRLYREALLAAENDGGAEPPDPYAAETSEAFVEWLREPAHAGSHEAVSRYALALYHERRDLQTAFPDPRWADADRYVEWLATIGRHEEKIPFELVPEPAADFRERPEPGRDHDEPGVNVAGYLRAEIGVGEAARHLIAAIEQAGIPYTTVTYARTPSRQQHPFRDGNGSAPRYDTNVICVNADQLPTFAYDMGPEFFDGRYSVGLWWWEIAEFPDSLKAAFDTIDEVWVGSDFARAAVAAATEKPVLTIPIGIEVPDDEPLDRATLGLPDGFLFLFTFDFFSVFERKNPLGLVEAFKRAFTPGEGPTLVLKSVNGDQRVLDLERLREAVADRLDIVVLDRYLSSSEKNALMASCDCYVSLHRSEGLGLTSAEAMARGRPVIATGYSGNLMFMDETNSYLVRHDMVPIPPGCDPYPPGVLWAEPDVEEAARLMRHVFEHPDDAAEKGRKAREDIVAHHSPQRTGAFVTKRLEEIRRERRSAEADAKAKAAEPSALDRAAEYLATEPRRTLTAPSRFGAFGRFARRVLYRVLRPHTVPQRIFETEVVHALRDTEGVLEQHRAAIDAYADEQRRMQQINAQISDALQRNLERVERQAQSAEREVGGMLATVQAMLANVKSLEKHLGLLTEDTSRHLEALEQRVADAEAGRTRVSRRRPRPRGGQGHDFAERFPPPDRPWTQWYVDEHRDLVSEVLDDERLLRAVRDRDGLPVGYGVGFDERVVEFPWLFAQGFAGRVLDAGSALNHEHILERLLPQIDDLHVVTLEPEEQAFPEKRVSYVYADLRDLPYPDGYFDTVVCLSTLEHIGMDNMLYGVDEPRAEDPEREMQRALGELIRAARSGGRLFITVPYGRREDHGWFRQFDCADVERLTALVPAQNVSMDVYRYSLEGWQVSSLEEASDARYRDFLNDPTPVDDLAAAARAVACIRFDL